MSRDRTVIRMWAALAVQVLYVGKGIYRHLSDDEVVYIGKGIIRDRYQAEPQRASGLRGRGGGEAGLVPAWFEPPPAREEVSCCRCGALKGARELY